LERDVKISQMDVEIEKEDDGRYVAEVPTIPGAMAYGETKDKAVARVEALVLRILADRLDHGESSPEVSEVVRIPA
jgi:predicted RNase H-like HicB family nuclease